MQIATDGIIEEFLTRLEIIQQHQDSLNKTIQFLHGLHRGKLDPVALNQIFIALHDVELDTYRGLFMFGLTLDDKERDRIKAAAYSRFLGKDSSAVNWMYGGVPPSKWRTADEEEFREMARVAFAPKEPK